MAQITTLPQRSRSAAPQIVVDLAGEVDTLTAGYLRQRIGQAMGARGTVVVLDASAVTSIDCAGLRELLAASTRLAASGRTLLVRSPSPPVATLLQHAGLPTGSATALIA